ncbi:MAG TPA: hypothetical protein DIT99_06910 [Candidatus Latescibacteria bacterium]|nr:hypothetical protein [Candidatus Latescibacterota bacterium]
MGKILSADHGVLNIRVLGVMKDVPENTHFSPDFFFSIFTMPVFYNANVLKSRDDNIFYTYIRLSPDALPSALEQKLPLFIDKYTRQPENAGGSTLEPSLQAVTDVHLYSHLENELGANSDIAYIYILSSVALFMLLIACINFMNMATARAAGRAREVGLRKVIGANRLQLIRQFLGESILISVFALFLAAALVQMVIPVFNTFADKDLTLAFNESGLILGLVGITLFVGIVSGVLSLRLPTGRRVKRIREDRRGACRTQKNPGRGTVRHFYYPDYRHSGRVRPTGLCSQQTVGIR